MGLFGWIFKKTHTIDEPRSGLSKGAIDFLDGKSIGFTAADIDPAGSALLVGYQKAMELKKQGKLIEAADLLLKSTQPASIYHGHYRELFRIWRQFNKEDLKDMKYREVSDRVKIMHRLDNEMIEEMLSYWGERQNRKLPKDFFDKDRNLLVSDIKALRKSAEALKNNEDITLSANLFLRFKK